MELYEHDNNDYCYFIIITAIAIITTVLLVLYEIIVN